MVRNLEQTFYLAILVLIHIFLSTVINERLKKFASDEKAYKKLSKPKKPYLFWIIFVVLLLIYSYLVIEEPDLFKSLITNPYTIFCIILLGLYFIQRDFIRLRKFELHRTFIKYFVLKRLVNGVFGFSFFMIQFVPPLLFE